jgi:putative endonuclease
VAAKVEIGGAFRWLRVRVRRLLERPDLGKRGEDVAVRELKRQGYEILHRRWRCRLGEIDVVARDGQTLVVVEVKARSRRDYGPPTNAVDAKKARRLERLARAYLRSRRLTDVDVRFDVVGVTFESRSRPRVEVFQDALRF